MFTLAVTVLPWSVGMLAVRVRWGRAATVLSPAGGAGGALVAAAKRVAGP